MDLPKQWQDLAPGATARGQQQPGVPGAVATGRADGRKLSAAARAGK